MPNGWTPRHKLPKTYNHSSNLSQLTPCQPTQFQQWSIVPPTICLNWLFRLEIKSLHSASTSIKNHTTLPCAGITGLFTIRGWTVNLRDWHMDASHGSTLSRLSYIRPSA